MATLETLLISNPTKIDGDHIFSASDEYKAPVETAELEIMTIKKRLRELEEELAAEGPGEEGKDDEDDGKERMDEEEDTEMQEREGGECTGPGENEDEREKEKEKRRPHNLKRDCSPSGDEKERKKKHKSSKAIVFCS